MNSVTDFPRPIPEYGSEPFWEGCNEERLLMQRCMDCGRLRWHPAPLCTYCQHDGHTWEPVSGRGRIHTWTVVTHPVHPGAVGRVPYVVVEVTLEEQSDLRLISNLIDAEPERIKMGAPVRVSFVQQGDGQKLPVFHLA